MHAPHNFEGKSNRASGPEGVDMKHPIVYVTETTEKARKRITPWHFILAFFLILFAGCLFRPASAAQDKDACPAAREPWGEIQGAYALLEDGRQVYLACAEMAEVSSGPFDGVSLEEEFCPLPVTIPGWSPKTLAKWYEVRQYCGLIVRFAGKYEIEVDKIAAVMLQESGGWSGAESSAGAMGAMQVMPFHDCATWDPVENIDCGVSILAEHVHQDGFEAGLAAYNAGLRGRDVNGDGWDFSAIVLAIYQQIQSARQ